MAVSSLAALSNELRIYDTTENYDIIDSMSAPLRSKEFGQITWTRDGKWIVLVPVQTEFVPIFKFRPLKLAQRKAILVKDVQSASFFNWTNKLIAIGTAQGGIHVWDIKNSNVSMNINSDLNHSVDYITVNSDDNYLATGSRASPDVHLYGLKTNKRMSEFTLPESTSISSLSFITTKKNFLAAASAESTVCVFDMLKSTPVFKSIRSHVGACTDISCSPTNFALLASVSMSKTLKLYDIREKKDIQEVPVGLPLTSVEFMSSGDKIATGCSEGSVLVYDLRNMCAVETNIETHAGPVLAVKMEPQVVNTQYRDELTLSGGKGAVHQDPEPQPDNISLIDIMSPIIAFSTPVTQQHPPQTDSASKEDSFLKLFTPENVPKPQKHLLHFSMSPAIREDDEHIKQEPNSSQVSNHVEEEVFGGAGDGLEVNAVAGDLVAEMRSLRSELKDLKEENAELKRMVSGLVNKKPLFHEAQSRLDYIGLSCQVENLFQFCEEQFEKIQNNAQGIDKKVTDVKALLEN